MRRYGWPVLVAAALAAWALNASRVGNQVEGCPKGCAVADERRDGPLRVMSLNMLHGFPRFDRLRERLDLIAEETLHQDADIVCLQEVPWAPHIGGAAQDLAERTGLNHVYFRANGNRWTILFEEGEAILSRYPLRDVRRTAAPSRVLRTPRGAGGNGHHPLGRRASLRDPPHQRRSPSQSQASRVADGLRGQERYGPSHRCR